MHPVADRLHPPPSWGNIAELLRCNRGESVDLAVPAIQQVAQDVAWQFLDRKLPCIRSYRIGEPRVVNQSRVAQAECALLRDEPGATVSEAVDEAFQLHAGRHTQFVGRAHVRNPGGMHVEQRHYSYRGRDLKLDVVS